MNNSNEKMLVIHVAREPFTGVWASILNLMRCQSKNENVIVRSVIFYTKKWYSLYSKELIHSELQFFTKKIPDFRMSYILLFFSSTLEKYCKDLIAETGITNVVLHFHNADFSAVFLPITFDKQHRKCIVVTYHGMPGIDKKFKLRRPWQKFLHRRLLVNHAILVSVDGPALLDAKRVLGYDDNNFKIIPNGIVSKQHVDIIRWNEEPLKIGFVGSLDDNKGWELIVVAIKNLLLRNVKINLKLAGTGIYEKKLLEIIKNTPEIQYCGFVNNASDTFMPNLDIIVVASKNEGMPMAVLEAMNNGIAVISTRVGAIPSIIADKEDGILIERTIDNIQNSIEELYYDRELLYNIKLNAIRKIKNNFSIDCVAEQYFQLYRFA